MRATNEPPWNQVKAKSGEQAEEARVISTRLSSALSLSSSDFNTREKWRDALKLNFIWLAPDNSSSRISTVKPVAVFGG